MDYEDIVYLLCLLTCIAISYYLRITRNRDKTLFTKIGLIMLVVLTRWNALHCIVSAGIGAACVSSINCRKCHLITFAVMFGYLGFFRLAWLFGLPDPPGQTNMIQMILTLKVTGLAFEKNASYKKLRNRIIDPSYLTTETKEVLEAMELDKELQVLSIREIFNYTFNYIGMITGPYYRYRTYRDYFETPFEKYAPWMEVTIHKLKYAGLFGIFYLICNFIWPLEYALSNDFMERSLVYRCWYIWPIFLTFRMRIYVGLILSECVCTMVGFGAYPDVCNAVSGEGPRKLYLYLQREAHKHLYNFNTITNVYPLSVETCITVREAMKEWNVCIQYWLAVNVYKLFPYKRYRTAVTLLVSAYWHGFRPGHYMCIMGAAFYVPIEDMWQKLLYSSPNPIPNYYYYRCIDVIFWVCKFGALSYLGTAFVLASFTNIWKYYSSVYHFGYILWIILFIVGYILQTLQKSQDKKENKQDLKVRNK